jgi:hypothetical protein
VTGISSTTDGVVLNLSGGMNRDTHRAGILPLLKEGGTIPLDLAAWDGKVISPRDGLQPVSLRPSGKAVLAPSKSSLLVRVVPSAGGYTVRVSGVGAHTLTVVDVAGRTLFSGRGEGQSSHRIGLGRAAPGMYFVRASGDGTSVRREIMVVR